MSIHQIGHWKRALTHKRTQSSSFRYILSCTWKCTMCTYIYLVIKQDLMRLWAWIFNYSMLSWSLAFRDTDVACLTRSFMGSSFKSPAISQQKNRVLRHRTQISKSDICATWWCWLLWRRCVLVCWLTQNSDATIHRCHFAHNPHYG